MGLSSETALLRANRNADSTQIRRNVDGVKSASDAQGLHNEQPKSLNHILSLAWHLLGSSTLFALCWGLQSMTFQHFHFSLILIGFFLKMELILRLKFPLQRQKKPCVPPLLAPVTKTVTQKSSLILHACLCVCLKSIQGQKRNVICNKFQKQRQRGERMFLISSWEPFCSLSQHSEAPGQTALSLFKLAAEKNGRAHKE